jgi:hypothetical protein
MAGACAAGVAAMRRPASQAGFPRRPETAGVAPPRRPEGGDIRLRPRGAAVLLMSATTS